MIQRGPVLEEVLFCSMHIIKEALFLTSRVSNDFQAESTLKISAHPINILSEVFHGACRPQCI